jgi:hypothetical protein
MTILLKYLTIIVPTAFASKLIFIQHIIFKYNRLLQQASEGYYETFIGTTNSFSLLF